MRARIYQPARNAMQSGSGNANDWVMEFASQSAREVDPLMGWTGSEDTQSQVKIRFPDQASAEKYANDHEIDYDLCQPNERKKIIRPGGYGENFATFRRGVWTH